MNFITTKCENIICHHARKVIQKNVMYIKEISKNHTEIDDQQLRNYREVFKGYFEPLKLNILND